jgi:hypothetical protein
MRVAPLKYLLVLLSLFGVTGLLVSCGGGYTPPVTDPYQAAITNPTTQQLTASHWNPIASGEQSFTVLRDSLFEQSCISCVTNQPAPSCSLVAGNSQMNFSANSSASWFSLSPIEGIIAPNGNTTIGLSYLDASTLTANNNTGTFNVTALNYKPNTQLSFTLTCGLYDGSGNETCHFAMVCPPCSMKGNTLISIASATRTNGGTASATATITLSTTVNLFQGNQIVISGVPDNSFNGTFTIASVVPNSNQVTILQPNLPDASINPPNATMYVPETVSCP